ncbi:MAG TPA: cupin domain-containing protein [Actinomycetales bacterium]|nr:cupin domain-containing protein [Actinomycetales bacterium]
MDPLDLLAGDATSFLSKIWAAQVHVHRDDPSEFTRLLSLDDVDQLLTSSAMRTPALRMAKDGAVLPSSEFTRSASLAGSPLTGLVDTAKVVDLVEDGATAVLQGLHRYWPPLTRLVRDLELRLGHPCQANAYLTPPSAQGFALHTDTHDVFVFQTHGHKRWEVHDAHDVLDVLLEPGVCMYMPTGTRHAARTEDATSLHVTVGINRISWRSVIRRVIDDLLADGADDAPIPAGYLDDPMPLATGLADRLAALATALDRVDPDALATEQCQDFLTHRPTVLPGALRDRLRLAEIDDDASLVRRHGTPCVLVRDRDVLRVLLGDRELRVPSRLEPPLSCVRDRERLRPADLAPWLDAESRLVLCRRLVREGLLQVEG